MEQSKIDMFVAANAKKFEPAQINQIVEILKNLPEEKFQYLNAVDFKDPQTLLIISIVAGGLGIDRFMLKDMTMGIIKLITLGGCGIWTIIDWFSVQKRTRELNFKLLQEAIGGVAY